MNAPSSSSNRTFILLYYLLFALLHSKCPSKCDGKAEHDHKKKCFGEFHCYQRQGLQKCDCCTRNCTEVSNEIEVSSCTLDHNRVCHCKPGFFCMHLNNYSTYCNKPCTPCKPGTFSSKPSLNSTCMPHTDCAHLGRIVLREGTATQDRECGHLVTTPTPSIIITTISSSTDSTLSPSTTDFTTQTTPTFITIKPITSPTMSLHSSRSQQKPSSPLATQTHRLSLRSTTEMASSPRLDANTSRDKSSERQPYVQLLWILFLILLLVMTSICLLWKRTAQKTIAKCTGFLSGQHEDQHICSNPQSQTSEDRKVEAELLHGSDVREVRGQSMGVMSPSGGVQQVSNGKGENVSNTVGSIYIYSPGTVILGSNSGDKQEEAKVFEENVPLISTPQQESTPPSNEIRIQMSAQEETEEELSLSFPVPATGK